MSKEPQDHLSRPIARDPDGVQTAVVDPSCGSGAIGAGHDCRGSASHSGQAASERPQNFDEALKRIREQRCHDPEKVRRVEKHAEKLLQCLSATQPRGGCGQQMTLRDLPCEPPKLRLLLARVKWSRHWTTKGSWSAIRSSMNWMLRETGWVDERGTDSAKLEGPWAVAKEAISSKPRKYVFAKFAQFLIAKGRTPETVTEEDLEEYRQIRLTRTIDISAESGIQILRCIWNGLPALVRGWPGHRLNPPKIPTSYSVPKEKLHPDFLPELDVYLSRLENPSPFDRKVGKPRAPATIKYLRSLFVRLESVLINQGWPANTFTSLLEPAAVEAVLMDQYVRLGKNREWPPGSTAVATNLITAIKLCRYLPEEERCKSLELCANVFSPTSGMTSRTRARLAEFDNPALLRRFLKLPARQFSIADTLFKRGRKLRAAQFHQRGIALAIQLCKPLRRLELARLHIDDHFRFNKKGDPNYFCIPGIYRGVRTKTGMNVEGYLTPDVSARLRIHLTKYQPILDKNATGYLFPGKYSGRMNEQSLARAITRMVEENIGTDYSTHFIRSLVATMIFDADVNNGPVAQRMLDHASLRTTTSAYGSLRTRAAQAQYVEILERALDNSEEPPKEDKKD